MTLSLHPEYEALIGKAQSCHQRNRSPEGITEQDIQRARLYCYALRTQAIGAFHATKVALAAHPPQSALAQAHHTRAVEALDDLANLATEIVPRDFRVVVTTLHRYHRGLMRAMDGLDRQRQSDPRGDVAPIGDRFTQLIETITSGNGIHLTQDTHAPQQGAFVVPNLGITIVPLVYGDHHSWNLAYLAGEQSNVPTHRHRDGVEIHLGYEPTHGQTILGRYRTDVHEGYAMPIPSATDHGWINTADDIHHVPFIFGSLRYGGWGVFLDVIPSTIAPQQYELVGRHAGPFSQMVDLERELSQAQRMTGQYRKTLIPASVTNRQATGGLELSVTRVTPSPFTYPHDDYRIISISRGQGQVTIEGIEQSVRHRDHFGVPAGMTCTIRQVGDQPLVAMDTIIKIR